MIKGPLQDLLLFLRMSKRKLSIATKTEMASSSRPGRAVGKRGGGKGGARGLGLGLGLRGLRAE